MRTVTNTMTTEERELLDNYRVLDEWGKHEVQEMIIYQQFKRVCNEYNVSSQEDQGNREIKRSSNIIRFRASTV